MFERVKREEGDIGKMCRKKKEMLFFTLEYGYIGKDIGIGDSFILCYLYSSTLFYRNAHIDS